MNPKTIALLKKHFKARTYKPNQVIVKAGGPNTKGYLVLQGVVKCVTYDRKGTERRLVSAQSGDIFPTIWLSHQESPVQFTYTAYDTVEVAILERKEFFAFLHKHPDILTELFTKLEMRVHYAKRRVEILIQERADDKFIIFLKYLADRNGQPTEKKSIVYIPTVMTQQEIADALGVSRETVSALFSDMYKKKIILKPEGRSFYIDVTKLKKLKL